MKYPRKVDYLKNRAGGVELWEEHWHKQDIKKQIERLKKDSVTPIVRRWIQHATGEGQSPRILDGGCGAGRYLVYFGKLGYDIIGADNSANAVRVAKSFDANLKVVRASVLDLPFDSQSFDHYLSFGVLEHFINGPEQGLKEAYRVLKKDGILFLPVPFMNNLRMLYEHIENFRSKISGRQKIPEGEFYQYYFTKKELKSILNSLGFEVLRDYPLNQELGLLRALPFVRKNRLSNYLTVNLAKAIKLFLPQFSPHMVLLICKKRELDSNHD